ncbi:glycoside hydrolase family 105 protein [Dysgonomonas sp. 520]|uniref:glycoside hydrolase family 88/105 protein n=1 Tax=Dysgonomonas sp. 520 TaxID=2302931 RepID=UPI0013D15493|nr:glycoside hydrolase family 88 protein [Dysgonomonas sp. 520]NDW08218.1 glycosyl hydrolase [Dysgonomonas sp. 520]
MKLKKNKWNKLHIGIAALALALASCGGGVEKDSYDLSSFPEYADPVVIGNKLADRFLEQGHSQYGSPLRINEPRTQVTYPDVCAWLGGFWFAKATQNDSLFKRLEARFDPLFTTEAYLQPVPNHVDNNVFGALPLELYMKTKEEKYRSLGMMYADTQWQVSDTATVSEKEWSDKGYSWQTRIWLDDMFMITAVQAQAYRVTKDTMYVNRAAREMTVYLDSIQLDNGLFYHSPEAHFCWGRGNGWMAVGMAELLRILPEDNPQRPEIMAAYKKMMATLKDCQDENGMWKQLVDDPTLWEETSGSAMFTYAMIVGVKKGWLDEKEYGKVARKGWLALVKFIDEKGDIKNVCEGTNIGFTTEYYRDRLPLTGDIHGQAPMLWCAYALLTNEL